MLKIVKNQSDYAILDKSFMSKVFIASHQLFQSRYQNFYKEYNLFDIFMEISRKFPIEDS